MGISSYPNGINDVILRGIPIVQTHPGEVFWVSNADVLLSKNNSVAGVDQAGGGTFQRPFRTIDFAVGQCTASRGDIIMVLPGHKELVVAAGGLDLDVAGIAIVFLGSGANKASIDFGTVVGADMDVDAANITLVNPLFTASLDALVGPIDINSSDFNMFNAEFRDGTGIDTTDCIVGDANAVRCVIDGWRYVEGDAAGTQKQSNIQFAAAADITLRNIDIVGDFATGNIENSTAWVDALLDNVHCNNQNSSPTVAMVLQATSTGSVRKSDFRIASGTTYITVGSNMQFFNAYGVGTDDGAGSLIGTQEDTGQNYIGVDDADNAVATTNVVANRDGSLLERTEFIMEEVGGTDSATNILGADDADNQFASTNVVANVNGSVLERLEDIAQHVNGTDVATNVLGADDADNLFASTNVAANRDGSLIERTEFLMGEVGGVDSATNILGADDADNQFASTNVAANRDGSLIERLEDIEDIQERTVVTSASVMADGDDIFTIAGGPIEILSLVSICSTGNDATASTLQYEVDPTAGVAVAISGASASLASALAGATVALQGTTLGTAALLNASGGNVGQSAGIIAGAGVISLIIGVGSTTGTWTHYIRYRPLTTGVTVT